MRQTDIVKDKNFEQIAEVKADAKNRIVIGKKGWKVKTKIFKVYTNSLGQIILDPQVTIPAYEQWLFENKTAKTAVMKGLVDAKERRLVKAPEDFSKYADET